jgi:lysophospholipase-2
LNKAVNYLFKKRKERKGRGTVDKPNKRECSEHCLSPVMRFRLPRGLSLAFSLAASGSSSVRAMSTSSSSKKKKGALIFLHGLGDTPEGWSSLRSQLPSLQPRLADLEYVFPAAPTLPITINGGMQMPAWFDVYDWPIGVGVQEDRKGKLDAVRRIENSAETLEKRGIPRERIVVGGFSQGGAIALLTAYHNANGKLAEKGPFAGCAVLSAWLTLADEMQVPKAAASKTPLFWAHGEYDDKVLFEQQEFGVEKLKEAGVKVEASNYPMGHGSDPREIEAFATWLDKLLFGSGKKEEEL